MKKRIVAFVVLVALLGGFAQPFSRVSPTAAQSLCTNRTTQCLLEMVYAARSYQEAEAIFASFTSTEQQLILEAMQPGAPETRIVDEGRYETTDVDGRAKICSTRTLEVITPDRNGNKVASFFQRIDWCWNNKKIKPDLTHTSWGHVYYLFYEFLGVTGVYTTGGLGQAEFYRWSQGKFQFCIPVVNQCTTWNVEASMTVRKDGTYNP